MNFEKPEHNLKIFFAMSVGLLIFVGIIAVTIFFFTLHGEEQTMVPEVRGMFLVDALLDLQVKELYPRLQLRYSQSARERGMVLEQDPPAGTIVKAGRRIRLVVSQGVVLDRVESYIGRNINDVRLELQTLAASSDSPLFEMREPPVYDFSPSAPGTILRQRPEPGADVSGLTFLEFVVSRGPDNVMVTVPQLIGLPLSFAIERISESNIAFEFFMRNVQRDEREESVVSQNPPADTSIDSRTPVSIVVGTPSQLGENEVFDIFSRTIPANPYPLPVRLDALLPSGERITLIAVNFTGGNFTVPYRLPVNSILLLLMMDREIYRETVSF
ncbi:MAG: PASTA domain-containing protein [Treponema sp.]|nr:PASTA domain-containing protein [Treponema sp.]